MARLLVALAALCGLSAAAPNITRLAACNSSNTQQPLGQWLYWWRMGTSQNFTMEFVDSATTILNPRLVLGVELTPHGWVLATHVFAGRNNTLRLWTVSAPTNGAGSTIRPVAAPHLCMTATAPAELGSAISLVPCRPMPPPAGGYANCTQQWYYGPGGANAALAVVMANPNGMSFGWPPWCATTHLGSATSAGAAAAEDVGVGDGP